MPIDPLLADYKTYPRMAHWFSPWLLTKLLNNVIVSAMFGQYADRRLMVAALDPVDEEQLKARTQDFREALKPDDKGNVWFDFVADLGDGFDPTYAVASLLAQKELSIAGQSLPRGQMLVMGGDEVYPAATQSAYLNQLRQPYAWASPDPSRKGNVPLLAIPGNHDWYDGLVLFLAFFCREKPWRVGTWRTKQRRSYFAIQLTEKWWLWAFDIQLDDTMDQPQADYFKFIAEKVMPRDAKIIMCGAEPGWLYTDTHSKSWEAVDFAIGFAHTANKGLSVPVLISGDTHHYSRYSAEDSTQFITSGGGGAFLHPTHQLQENVKIVWVGEDKNLSLRTEPTKPHGPSETDSCYPSKFTSRWLLLHNIFFAFKNWDFSLLMGVIYFLGGVLIVLHNHPDTFIGLVLLFGWVIIGYTKKQEKATFWWPSKNESEPTTQRAIKARAQRLEKGHKEKTKSAVVFVTSALHTAAHVWALWYFASWADEINARFAFTGEWHNVWIWLGVLLVEMGLVGFFVGSSFFGWNMMITSALFRMNTNDAFSAFRHEGYKNFLRFHFNNEELEIYAIGLDRVPRREDWVANRAHATDKTAAVFVPTKPLCPHLIEKIQV